MCYPPGLTNFFDELPNSLPQTGASAAQIPMCSLQRLSHSTGMRLAQGSF